MPDPTEMDPRQIETLLAIMKALRNPQTGCPWDLQQSFETIAPYTIEEAYEVADAIRTNNMDDLCEELGDLLLQPIYHAQLASERSAFDFADVVEGICEKMIRRHPHVFGDAVTRAQPLVKGFWEAAKAKEQTSGKSRRTLDNIPISMPGLTRAIKLQNKAAKVGFDWPDVKPVLDKVREELHELEQAKPEHRAEELGDLLFVVANLARHFQIDPEAALRAANAKFERRFSYIEEQLEQSSKTPSDSDLAEMDELWNEAKRKGL
jgi:nucleoside triphosphate diphosphatase